MMPEPSADNPDVISDFIVPANQDAMEWICQVADTYARMGVAVADHPRRFVILSYQVKEED